MCSSETSVEFIGLHGVMSQKRALVMTTVAFEILPVCLIHISCNLYKEGYSCQALGSIPAKQI
jgi:hypothetical protein